MPTCHTIISRLLLSKVPRDIFWVEWHKGYGVAQPRGRARVCLTPHSESLRGNTRGGGGGGGEDREQAESRLVAAKARSHHVEWKVVPEARRSGGAPRGERG